MGGITLAFSSQNNNPENPNVVGVQGILDAYRYALSQSALSGPTNFENVIQSATLLVNEAKYSQNIIFLQCFFV